VRIKGGEHRVFRNAGACVICSGYVGILKVHRADAAMKQGGTADKTNVLFVLDRNTFFCRGRFVFECRRGSTFGGAYAKENQTMAMRAASQIKPKFKKYGNILKKRRDSAKRKKTLGKVR